MISSYFRFTYFENRLSMALWRRITSILSIAVIVASGVVASTHTHSHESADGTRELHTGRCAHQCCGHDHSHESPEHSDNDRPSTPDHDHDDCQVCRSIANFQSTTIVAIPTVYEALVVAQFFKTVCEPTDGLFLCAVARGPPALAASDS